MLHFLAFLIDVLVCVLHLVVLNLVLLERRRDCGVVGTDLDSRMVVVFGHGSFWAVSKSVGNFVELATCVVGGHRWLGEW